jgi:hypothetical protein
MLWPYTLAILFNSRLVTTATTAVSSGNISLQLLRTVVNASNLDYAVESRIYAPEAPDLLFVTHRASPPHASISVFDLSGGLAAVAGSKAAVAGGGGSGGSGGGVGGGSGAHALPPLPTLRARWVGQSVEGQDRRGDLLVVTALGNRASNGSKLLLFNASEAAAGNAGLLGGGGPFATLPLSFDGALHVKIYVQQPPPQPAATTATTNASTTTATAAATTASTATATAANAPRPPRVYAIITAGLTSAAGADRTLVAAVDITDPTQPVEVARTSTACKCAEGVTVVPAGGGAAAIDVAFIGSYCSNEVATLDLSQLPAAMPQLRSRSDPGYENMVSAVRNSSYQAAARRRPLQQTSPQPPPPLPLPPRRLLYSASYASPGGLVIFDADAMGRPNGSVVEVGRAIALPSSRANRVHLSADGRFALLALEKSPPAPLPPPGLLLPNGTTTVAAPAPETGGVAVVDIRDPASPALLAVARVPDNASRAYCLATREAPGPGGGLLVFVFGATAEAMYTYLLSGYDA